MKIAIYSLFFACVKGLKYGECIKLFSATIGLGSFLASFAYGVMLMNWCHHVLFEYWLCLSFGKFGNSKGGIIALHRVTCMLYNFPWLMSSGHIWVCMNVGDKMVYRLTLGLWLGELLIN